MKLLKRMLKKIKCFFTKIFKGRKQGKYTEETLTPVVTSVPIPVTDEGTQSLEDTRENNKGSEPAKSSENAVIQTFLWKPTADHNPFPVIVVSCDMAKSSDLRCEIISKTGKQLAFLAHSGSRANQLPGFKFGRVHFRLTKSAKSLVRSAPVTVKFYLQVGRRTIPLKGKAGNDSFLVKNPVNRVDRR
jgi:hypothetical protein